jgi:serine/threonine-protein kinase
MVDICRRVADQLADKLDAPTAEHTIACLKNIPKLDLPSHYELQEPVGEGQFARCYRAHDHLLDRKVIVKVVNAELSRDSPAYDKYVRSAARLNHRNILGVLFSQANKLPHFLVTPATDGVPLDARLSPGPRRKRLSFRDAVTCTARLAEALAYAHARGCVHGRLRPSEVRFDHEDQPVLSGFRTIESCAEAPSVGATISLEDFQYSSPERRERGTIDPKGDQYLLGLLAYEMIAGVPPVRIPRWSSLFDPKVVEALLRPPPLKSIVPGCDETVSDVVMRMLSVEPEARWDSLDTDSLDTVQKMLQRALSHASCVEEAKKSYRRCAHRPAFYKDLYDDLFASMPAIRGMFTSRTMDEQYRVLADALWLLLTFPDLPEEGEPTILSGIARSHARFEPKQFDRFRSAVLKAVARHDPRGIDVVNAWRDAMKPGFDYLKASARGAAHVPAPPGRVTRRASGRSRTARRIGASPRQ